MASPHTLLLKCRDDDAPDDALVSEVASAVADIRLEVGRMHVHRALTAGEVYAYLELARASQLSSGEVVQLVSEAHGHPMLSKRVSAIDLLDLEFEAAGASRKESPRFHYVVEMDPEADWQDEIIRWYDTEHMPGLAAAPGCVRARRFLNRGAGPHSLEIWKVRHPVSLACYDLTRPETVETAPWLAIRHTAWSDRVRPHFQNPKRTMFRTLADSIAAESEAV